MLILPSPAKINLYLDVLDKRDDGYHNILSVMHKIGLCDQIFLYNTGGGIEVTCDDPDVPKGRENLAYRAAELLIGKLRISYGIGIKIVKKVPVGGGLGGGSSNAATVMLGLNEMWKLGLNRRELAGLGAEVGSDVPFFILGGNSAVVKGKGDQIIPVSCAKSLWFLLLNPRVKVSTKYAYDLLDATGRLTKPAGSAKLLVSALECADCPGIERNMYNIFEEVVLRRHPVVTEVKSLVRSAGIRTVLMSGTGSTVFGMVQHREEAVLAKAKIKEAACNVFVARTWNS
jgi:4-diphosphocytidyl-2-C-methyl-D-erythritol kinase